MAVLKGGTRPPGRDPSFRGVLMMDAFNGQLRVRAWPGKRRKRITQAERDLQDAFRKAMKTAKQWPPDMQADYRKAVEGTALLPTDLIMMTIYGNAFAIKLDDGRTLYSMITRAKVSESLDIISQVPGTILARGETYWGEVPPGTEGQVLLMSADHMPYWADVATAINAAVDEIDANQTRYQNTYGDLATVGPSVTIVTGTDAIVFLSCISYNNAGGSPNTGYMSVEVSNASTIAASDALCCAQSDNRAGYYNSIGRVVHVSGLTPGANTFTAKYRSDGLSWGFFNRCLSAIAI